MVERVVYARSVTTRPRSTRRMVRWKPALNAFAIAFEGRIIPTTDQ